MTKDWKQWEGQVVNGEFHLRRYLGGSDHSAVFLTERGEERPQKAAIKLIPADPGTAELQLARWRQATGLSHPHLIRLFQMGQCQLGGMGLLYVVMEYAEEELSQVLPWRTLTPAETGEMLQSVLDALAYVHDKGFVHGHVKPANIVAVNDQLKISSDGLCGVSESGGRLGKPSVYDAPEIASGPISPAADVWSLGMTLVEALTQRLPVWERTEQWEPVLEVLPTPFHAIACQCLRRDPQQRGTVVDIAAQLQLTSIAPRKQTTAEPQEPFLKGRYLVPMVAVGLALVAMLAGPRLLNRRPEAQPVPSIAFEPPRVQPQPEQRPASREAGPSTQKSSVNKPSPSSASQSAGRIAPSPTTRSPIAASPTSLRSTAAAKTLTGSPVRGEVLQQVLPDVPQSARDTIRGTVRVGVRVAVDPSGGVVGATLDSPGPSKYFARLAMAAARRWEFDPARVDDRYVTSEWVLRFEFRRTATKVFPIQVAP
jgi:serine/threonine-protein kinase